MNAIPQPGTEVVLRDQGGGSYRSRVEAVEAGQLVLFPPADSIGDRTMAPGTRLLVTWPDQFSLWVLPVVLVEVQPTADGAMLAVEINGEPWREERRQYARAVIPAELEIRFARAAALADPPTTSTAAGGSDTVAVPASLINLSEVALRCALPPAQQSLYQPRVPVTVEIGLPGGQFHIPGYVLQAKATAQPEVGFEVVILFDRPVDRVEELRAQLSLG